VFALGDLDRDHPFGSEFDSSHLDLDGRFTPFLNPFSNPRFDLSGFVDSHDGSIIVDACQDHPSRSTGEGDDGFDEVVSDLVDIRECVLELARRVFAALDLRASPFTRDLDLGLGRSVPTETGTSAQPMTVPSTRRKAWMVEGIWEGSARWIPGSGSSGVSC